MAWNLSHLMIQLHTQCFNSFPIHFLWGTLQVRCLVFCLPLEQNNVFVYASHFIVITIH